MHFVEHHFLHVSGKASSIEPSYVKTKCFSKSMESITKAMLARQQADGYCHYGSPTTQPLTLPTWFAEGLSFF
jgi:hypothetical protein